MCEPNAPKLKAYSRSDRTTFYELCARYLSRHFMIAVGVNHPSGRNDWEAVGRAGTPFENRAAMIEFKHVSRSEGERLGVAAWSEPRPEDIEQVNAYADDLKRRYPQNS